jgi:hypothetical protein
MGSNPIWNSLSERAVEAGPDTSSLGNQGSDHVVVKVVGNGAELDSIRRIRIQVQDLAPRTR